ncbi:MAG: HlyC/CorC family transporter [Bryobacterales bacterium]|nr:HlyC/CorC family transporter [Bryobacterales bacterium]MBV9399542.1 HlyC/CorC family transporter [Bryobacterales bacterium]
MPLRFILLAFILAMNAFFAAAEVSLVSVRRSRLKELAGQQSVPARAALELLANPERLLSVTQVGVTLASLGLGWAGEDTLYRLFLRMFQPVITPATSVLLHAASFALGFLAMSFFHVVLGEVVPKNLAIEKADRLALLVAPVLLVFYRIALPFIFVIERSAAGLSRLLGLRGHGAGGHSSEELKFIVESSRREGHLEGFEQVAIQKLLELHDVNAREIMTPRIDIISVSVEASLDELLRAAIEHQYSRMPVYEGKPEHIVGIVHFKDLMRAWQIRKTANDRRLPAPPFRLRRYLREPLVVPETKALSQLVDEFRSRHAHMAMVVDEFGTVTGLVTLEDVLAQIFGAMGDEHDVRRPKPAPGAPVIEVEGATNIRELASEYGIELPGDAGFETLAGFLLFRLGYIPAPGEAVTYGSRTFIVEEMERNRIARVKIVTARPAETAPKS